jgi:Arc/MetJ-type ribon-helix-helix transcriptional regulator
MAQVAKVTISLPSDLLEYVERKQQENGVSRSEVVRRAIERLRREEWEREIDEQYARGWREQPQTEEEFGWLEVSLGSLADLPWEEEHDDASRRDLVGEPATSLGTPSGPPRRAR